MISHAKSVVTKARCSRGCAQQAKFISTKGLYLCDANANKCPAVRKRISEKLVEAYASGRKKPALGQRDYSAIAAKLRARGKVKHDRLMLVPFEEVPWRKVKARIMFDQKDKCAICSMLPVWQGKPLIFHLDHIRGHKFGNVRSNLRVICPNCHTQTETYCMKRRPDYGECS